MLPAKPKEIAFGAVGYVPNPEQSKIHYDDSRLRLVAGGERSGKSFLSAKELYANAYLGGLYWIVGPDYEQAKAEFDYILADFVKLRATDGQPSVPREGSRMVRLKNGAEILTKTAEDVLKLASKAPDGILMVEAAQQTWDSFQRLWNRLAEKRGWMLVSGTFETSLSWYADLWNTLQGPNLYSGKSFSLPTWSNLAVFPGGERDPEIERLRATNPSDLFMERFGGIPCPPRTLVFPEFRPTIHVKPITFGPVASAMESAESWVIPYDSRIQLAIDPGYRGAYAVLFCAVVGTRVFVLDEIYAKGQTAEEVIYEAQRKKDLWRRVDGGVIDIAGRQHQGMESHEEIWRRLGRVALRSMPVPIVDGISVTRRFLRDPMTGHPRLLLDPKCKWTAWEASQYKYREEKEGRSEHELPIDANNHSWKAIAYLLSDQFGFVDRLNSKKRSIYHRFLPGAVNA